MTWPTRLSAEAKRRPARSLRDHCKGSGRYCRASDFFGRGRLKRFAERRQQHDRSCSKPVTILHPCSCWRNATRRRAVRHRPTARHCGGDVVALGSAAPPERPGAHDPVRTGPGGHQLQPRLVGDKNSTSISIPPPTSRRCARPSSASARIGNPGPAPLRRGGTRSKRYHFRNETTARPSRQISHPRCAARTAEIPRPMHNRFGA